MHGSAAGTGVGRDANINQFVLRGRGVRGRGSGHRGRTDGGRRGKLVGRLHYFRRFPPASVLRSAANAMDASGREGAGEARFRNCGSGGSDIYIRIMIHENDRGRADRQSRGRRGGEETKGQAIAIGPIPMILASWVAGPSPNKSAGNVSKGPSHVTSSRPHRVFIYLAEE